MCVSLCVYVYKTKGEYKDYAHILYMNVSVVFHSGALMHEMTFEKELQLYIITYESIICEEIPIYCVYFMILLYPKRPKGMIYLFKDLI